VGLIITEGVSIDHPGAAALPDVPQFYGQEALAAWKVICDLVHGEGGRIVPQLWHVGAMRRASEGIGPAPGYGPVEIVENNQVVVSSIASKVGNVMISVHLGHI
jgi:2,4-dienoyl-CoA reductase-like NADH-dependent reductase (Old Yellow Enzyme family)